jgi:hypothetical protein
MVIGQAYTTAPASQLKDLTTDYIVFLSFESTAETLPEGYQQLANEADIKPQDPAAETSSQLAW